MLSKKFWKLLVFFAVLIISYGIGVHLLRFHLILPEFLTLEHHEDSKCLNGVKELILREAYHMDRIASDWAFWDDMYKYVQDKNKAFAESNFQWESLNASGIDLIYIYNSSGNLVWGGIHDPELNKNITLSEFSNKFNPKLYCRGKNKNCHNNSWGILMTEIGPMFISVQPILTSTGSGPQRGNLVMGKFLRKKTINELVHQIHLHFTLKSINDASINNNEKSILNKLTHGKTAVFKALNDNIMDGYSLINDILGKPAILITASFPREIMKRGKITARLVSYTIIAASFVMAILIITWFIAFRTEMMRRQKKIENLVRQRTQKMQESEERLRTLINATPDIICFKDHNLRWLEANKADLELFHLTDVDYKGKTDAELASMTHPVFKNALLACEKSDKAAWEAGGLSRQEETINTPDGSSKIYDVIKIPVFHNDGSRKGLIVFGRDITKERILQDKLQKAEKMEAIGLMAGGVAHDLNNILSGIVGYPDLLLMQLPKDSKLRKPIEAIRESGKRASEVVADLLTIARGVVAQKKIINLNNLIKEYLNSPEYEKIKAMHPDICLQTKLSPDLLNISCSPIHIKKCLMNLITNAAEAIEGRGNIIISTKNKYIDKPLAGNLFMEKGEYAVLSVTDTGSGIPEKDINRIFEPFYTKKVMGQSGTGLGLAVVWNTVMDHNGGIKVDSNANGTVFKLYFPATQKNEKEKDKNIKLEDLDGHGKSILVVDDDPYQRDIATKILRSLNYKVESVDSGESAIEYLKNNEIDLVILDMIMEPGINGRQTYEKITEINPNQKAIIISGFIEDEEVKKTQRLGAGQFIKKPYIVNQIGSAIKQELFFP